jgi:predicted secreted Zn-dependent protease
VTPLHLIAFVIVLAAILVLNDLYRAWRQKWWLDSANIPWSTGDIAAMQHGSLSDAAAVPELRGIPNVTVSYYDIDATDAPGITWALWAEAININGRRANALSNWWYDWRWDSKPGGSCGTANATVSFRAHVTLPRVRDFSSLSPEVARDWQAYSNAIIRHEASHVRRAYEGRKLVTQALRSSNCAAANAAGQSAIEEISRKESAHDYQAEQGRSEDAVFAWGWGWRGSRNQGPAKP